MSGAGGVGGSSPGQVSQDLPVNAVEAPPEVASPPAAGPATAPGASPAGVAFGGPSLQGDVLRAKLWRSEEGGTSPAPVFGHGPTVPRGPQPPARPPDVSREVAQIHELLGPLDFLMNAPPTPENIRKIVDVLHPLPIGGSFDQTILEMSKRKNPDGGTDLEAFLAHATLDPQSWGWVKGWLSDPNLSPEARGAALRALANVAYARNEVRSELQEIVRNDPAGFARAIGRDPSLLDAPLLGELAGEALTPELLGVVLEEMRATAGGYHGTEGEYKAIAKLFKSYLATHAGDDPEKLKAALQSMLNGASQSGLLDDPEDMAMVMAGLIAGVKSYANTYMKSAVEFAGVLEILGKVVGAVPHPASQTAGKALGYLSSALKLAAGQARKTKNFDEVAKLFHQAVLDSVRDMVKDDEVSVKGAVIIDLMREAIMLEVDPPVST